MMMDALLDGEPCGRHERMLGKLPDVHAFSGQRLVRFPVQQGNCPEVSNSKGPFCTSKGYDTQTVPSEETYAPACDSHTS